MSLRELLPRDRRVPLHKATLRLQLLFQARVTIMSQILMDSLRIPESAPGLKVEAVYPSIPPRPAQQPLRPAAPLS